MIHYMTRNEVLALGDAKPHPQNVLGVCVSALGWQPYMKYWLWTNCFIQHVCSFFYTPSGTTVLPETFTSLPSHLGPPSSTEDVCVYVSGFPLCRNASQSSKSHRYNSIPDYSDKLFKTNKYATKQV